MKNFSDVKRRRRRLPEDNFSDEQWERHKEIVEKKSKLWAKAQPERWKDLDPWKCPEVFAVFHCLKMSMLPDLLDELGEKLRKFLSKRGIDADARQIGTEIVTPLVWRFAGATLKFPSESFLTRCMQEAMVWMELTDAPNSEKAAVIEALALRYDVTPGKIQKIYQRMSEEYGKVK